MKKAQRSSWIGCLCSKEDQNHCGHQEEQQQQLMRGDFSPLLIRDISADLGSVLGSPVHEKLVHTGISPVKSHKDDKGPGASDTGGEDEGAGTVWPG